MYIAKNIARTVYTTVWFIVLSETTIVSNVYGRSPGHHWRPNILVWRQTFGL
jgi:hypothetical protein